MQKYIAHFLSVLYLLVIYKFSLKFSLNIHIFRNYNVISKYISVYIYKILVR